MVRYKQKFSLKRKWHQTKALILILTVLGQSITPVLGEWASILDQAIILPVANLSSDSSAKENLINKTFKAGIWKTSEEGIYKDYSNWYTIDLGTTKKVVAAFVVGNASTSSEQKRFGISYICMGPDPTGPKSTGNLCTTAMYSGGFIQIDLPPNRYVFLH